MHLRLIGMFWGRSRYQASRQCLVLHHITAPCLHPVAYRDVYLVICQTANSVPWQAALGFDFALAHTLRAFIRLFPHRNSTFQILVKVY